MTLKYNLIFALLAFLSACSYQSNKINMYRAEAEAYCNVHTSDYWIKSGRLDELNAMRPTDKQKTLMKEIRSSISSEEMKKIIFDEGGTLSAKEFYPFLQKKIPELTKEAFECPAIQEFYLSQQSIYLNYSTKRKQPFWIAFSFVFTSIGR